LLHSQSGEIPQLNNACVTRAVFGEASERVVEINELRSVYINCCLIFVETQHLDTFTAFDGESPAGAINEDLTHGAARCGEEVRSATLGSARVIDELEVNLVNEASCLKRVLSLFVGELAMREGAQLVVHECDQLVESYSVTVFCCLDQISCRLAK
jgi:hypothetical protein